MATVSGNNEEFGNKRGAIVLRGLAVTVFGRHSGVLAGAETRDRDGCFLVMDFTVGGTVGGVKAGKRPELLRLLQ